MQTKAWKVIIAVTVSLRAHVAKRLLSDHHLSRYQLTEVTSRICLLLKRVPNNVLLISNITICVALPQENELELNRIRTVIQFVRCRLSQNQDFIKLEFVLTT